MNQSYCGVCCQECPFQSSCKGCMETNGKPFGETCALVRCVQERKVRRCEDCSFCILRNQLLEEISSLQLEGLGPVNDLNALCGAFVNLAYPLSNGESIKLLDDKRIYLGTQVEKPGEERCFGIVADQEIILVAEYGPNGDDPQLLLYKKR